jgi:hypothetical protein
MNARFFWLIAGLVLVFAVFGAVSFDPPQREDIELQLLVDFFRNQYVVAAVIGLASGGLLGWLARRSIRHRPGDRGVDFDSRVAARGLVAGFVAVLFTSLATLTAAYLASWEPLAPGEKVVIVAQAALFYVVLAIAFVSALAMYALLTRVGAWGGQYALVSRPRA